MEGEKEAPSKKRVAGREISRDNQGLDDDDCPEPEMGTFKRASEEVLASRRIVKVRRQQPQASSSNPFADISFVTPNKATEKTDSPADKDPALFEKSIVEEQNNGNDKHSKALEDKLNKNGDKMDGENSTEGRSVGSNRSSEGPAPEKNNADNMVALSNDDKASQECQGGDTHEIANEAAKNDEGTNEGEAVDKTTTDDGVNDGDEAAKETGEESKEAGKEVATGEKKDNDRIDKTEPTACLSSFQQLSSNRNAFTGLSGTGFSGSTFSFGSKDGPSFGFSSGSVFGQGEKSSFPAFGVGSTGHGSSSVQLFGSVASDATRTGATSTPVMKEVAVETGEENEKVIFNADAILFEYIDGGWKERGKGEIRVNISILGDGRARLVMRTKGNYRLILNSSIYPDMSLKNMDKRGITFACVNSAGEGKCGLTTFALKFKDSLIMEEFRETVTTHKEKIS